MGKSEGGFLPEQSSVERDVSEGNQRQTQVYMVKANFIQGYDNRGKDTPACDLASFKLQQIGIGIHIQKAGGLLAGKLIKSGRDSG